MAGEEPLQAGSSYFHLIFSSLLYRSGRFFAEVVPSPLGPRQLGQLAPQALCATRVMARRRPVDFEPKPKRETRAKGGRFINQLFGDGRVARQRWGSARRVT
jgi:hypothetical protein